MRESVFRMAENHNTPASAPTASVNILLGTKKIYVLSEAASKDIETVRAYHLALIAAGASEVDDAEMWQNYVVTMIAAALPELRASLKESPEYEEVILPDVFVTSLVEWAMLCGEANLPANSEEDKESARDAANSMLPFDWKLPFAMFPRSVNIADVLSAQAIYGHFSLILFLGGKNITDKNRIAITHKRPGAIEGKYFDKKNIDSLTGSLSLSRIAHRQINLAFTVMTPVRKATFMYVAGFTVNPQDARLEIVATTTRLMRFAGMQQAVIIDDFLSGHEEAMSVPFLMPAINAYVSSMRNLMAAPSEQRAFYKLIHGDTTRAFNRNEILPLLTVALVAARELNPTLMNYDIPANYQLVMDKYTQALQVLANAE